MDLLLKFCPVVQFDSNEKHFPCSIEYMLSHSILQNSKHQIVVRQGDLNLESLEKYTDVSELKIVPSNENDDFEFDEDDVRHAPMYGSVSEYPNHWLLQYFILYPITNYETCCHDCLSPLLMMFNEANQRDDPLFPHIKILVNKATNQISRVYFDGTEQWHMHKDLKFQNEKLIIYSALDSHLFYPSTGSYPKMFGFHSHQNDGLGFMWDEPSVEVTNENMVWIRFKGSYGLKMKSPLYQPWWLNFQNIYHV